jgi:hypothetical protein
MYVQSTKLNIPAASLLHTQVEERAVGRVEREIYKAYLSAWSTTLIALPVIVAVMAFGERGLQVRAAIKESNAKDHMNTNDTWLLVILCKYTILIGTLACPT